MNEPRTPAAKPEGERWRLSRRRLLGGALAATLAATLLPADRIVVPARPWKGKARWIGHW
jgi:hypothetical protein